MPRKRSCDFCESDIEPGTGTMFVQVDGTTTYYCSSKCEKNADLGREARDLEWAGQEDLEEAGEVEEEEAEEEADEAEDAEEAEADEAEDAEEEETDEAEDAEEAETAEEDEPEEETEAEA